MTAAQARLPATAWRLLGELQRDGGFLPVDAAERTGAEALIARGLAERIPAPGSDLLFIRQTEAGRAVHAAADAIWREGTATCRC